MPDARAGNAPSEELRDARRPLPVGEGSARGDLRRRKKKEREERKGRHNTHTQGVSKEMHTKQPKCTEHEANKAHKRTQQGKAPAKLALGFPSSTVALASVPSVSPPHARRSCTRFRSELKTDTHPTRKQTKRRRKEQLLSRAEPRVATRRSRFLLAPESPCHSALPPASANRRAPLPLPDAPARSRGRQLPRRETHAWPAGLLNLAEPYDRPILAATPSSPPRGPLLAFALFLMRALQTPAAPGRRGARALGDSSPTQKGGRCAP